MKIISQCPVCGQGAGREWPSLVAPFIASFVLESSSSPCSLLECESCGLRFFNGRFEPEELNRLYADYRGESYFRSRHGFEPWYGKRHNQGTGHDPKVLAQRKAYLGAFLKQHGLETVERVLDYGGDSGQFIPDGIGNVRHVFEVSAADPVNGVTKISDEEALSSGSYDLILLSHVLEHVPDPVELLHSLFALLKPGGGALYIEVPHERYRIWSGSGILQQRYLAWLCRHSALLRLVDFLSTSCRVALGVIPPFGFPKLHEHINLFDETSLRKACEGAGLLVEDCPSVTASGDTVISFLAKRKA
jgi:SAM-dependent methyltransferase